MLVTALHELFDRMSDKSNSLIMRANYFTLLKGNFGWVFGTLQDSNEFFYPYYRKSVYKKESKCQ